LEEEEEDQDFKMGNKRASLVCLFAFAILLTQTGVSDSSWLESLGERVLSPVRSAIRDFARPFLHSNRVARASDQDSKGTTDSNINTSSSSSNPNNSSSNGTRFQAMCLVKRQAQLSDNPSLYFFSSKLHSPKTLGCSEAAVKFTLNSTANAERADYSEDADDWRNNENEAEMLKQLGQNISQNLIEPQLYDASLKTYILIHGFLASWDSSSWMCKTKDLLLNNTQANVFIVDWSGGSKPMLPIDYSAAVSNTKFVAQLIGHFVSSLLEQSGQRSASRFHLVGHSLGAHISGFVGYSVGSIGRITGLDPAGPCFGASSGSRGEEREARESGFLDEDSSRRRLSPASANLVVALHTDVSLFGLNENCAHYDVYVNGGFKQPECTSLNPADRLKSFLELDFSSSFSFDLACAHSYAHDLLDTFAPLVGTLLGSTTGGQSGASRQANEEMKEEEERCYPMAFACNTWSAFKAGECGFCLDDDPRCIFTGLSFEDLEPKREGNSSGSGEVHGEEEGGEEEEGEEEDESFNGEKEAEDPELARLEEAALGSFSQGQHFLKSGAHSSSSCLYQYQVVVATNASSEGKEGGKRYFYLQIPLEQRAVLADSAGKRLQDRLVQVSHRVKAHSPAHSLLSGQFLDELAQLHSSGGDGAELARKENANFYTALITFASAPGSECPATSSAPSGDNRRLCRPLAAMREARLWSASEQQLNSVSWVALNYMSGINLANRLRYSHLLAAEPAEGVRGRAELDSEARPSVQEVGQRSSANSGLLQRPGRLLANTLRPLDCLVSSVNPFERGSSANNLKCQRSSVELKYSLRLRPIKRNKATLQA